MSRYFAAANSIAQMSVTGEMPNILSRISWFSEALTAHAFQSIDETTDEVSYGWVQADEVDDSTFETPNTYMRDRYALFTLRYDQRKIAAVVLKAMVTKEEKKYLLGHPNFRRVPKSIREEIKERVRLLLLAKTPPTPSFIDVAWDLDGGVISVFSTSTSAIDKFETLFRKTFEGFHLTLIHPMARAKGLVEKNDGLLAALVAEDLSGSDDVAAQIKANAWLGQQFFLWLLHHGVDVTQEHTVCTPGHNQSNLKFDAYIDDKIEMVGAGSEGSTQQIYVKGNQDAFKETKSALTMHKHITSATIYIEMAENMWKITLDGLLFTFKSFKSPGVHIEKDTPVDEMSAVEGMFYEKIYLIESGLQCFDSLLLEFLTIRFDGSWGATLSDIEDWAATVDSPQ